MRTLPYGDRALLVELGSTHEAVAYAAGLRAAPPERLALVEQVVPAARTVLVVAAAGTTVPTLRRVLDEVEPVAADDGDPLEGGPREGGPHEGGAEHDPEVVEVQVVYDGEDLDDVAALTGLTTAEVVAAHTEQRWRVAFGGFAPGFGYLVGSDERLHVARREESRTAVPRGAVGLAGEYSGVYPTSSPGGWQLIGRTDAVLWDVDRDPPALFRPGVEVRFVEHRADQ